MTVEVKDVTKKQSVIKKDELLTRYYIGLFIVVFVSLVFFQGLLKAILFAVGISIIKYLFDKYVMSKMNPFIDKIIEWIKNKLYKS